MSRTSTAPDVADLVDRYTPLALSIANRFAKWYPWLLHDIRSDATFALWRAAREWSPAKSAFPTWARKRIRWYLVRRLQTERNQSPASFGAQHVPTNKKALSPIDSAPSREIRPDQVAELRDDVAALPRLLATMPEDRRSTVVRRIVEGVTLPVLAAERGVTRSAIQQSIERDLADLRYRATGEIPPEG